MIAYAHFTGTTRIAASESTFSAEHQDSPTPVVTTSGQETQVVSPTEN